MMPGDACGREAQARRAVFVFAVEWADERSERTAVAHFQSAWCHSLMAGSPIRDETGCHSLPAPTPHPPPFWCKEPPPSLIALRRDWRVSNMCRAACAHTKMRDRGVCCSRKTCGGICGLASGERVHLNEFFFSFCLFVVFLRPRRRTGRE